MKKSADISKYDLDWQVHRMSLKLWDNWEDKTLSARIYLKDHPDEGNKERVLNYLEGLALAYPVDIREKILLVRNDLAGMKVGPAKPAKADFKKHDLATLHHLARDLQTRAEKWLKKGYRSVELLGFLTDLLTYIEDEDRLERLSKAIDASREIPNTHKFFF